MCPPQSSRSAAIQDIQADARAEEGGEPEGLPHLTSVFDDLGVTTFDDLSYIYVEDLLQYEVVYDDAVKQLQGHQSSGAIRPHRPRIAEKRDATGDCPSAGDCPSDQSGSLLPCQRFLPYCGWRKSCTAFTT